RIMKQGLLVDHHIMDEIPFDSERKRMSVLLADAEGNKLLYSKGAPDVLLPLCTHYLDSSITRRLTPEKIEQIQATLMEMGDAALRVLAVAYRRVDTLPRQV
ncbi:MAG TPA: ATPase, partial [Firmicutes bacterium]|nr:ATPase [Bacillota bacterium]